MLRSGTPLLLELRTHLHFAPNIEHLSCFISFHSGDRAPHLYRVHYTPSIDHFCSEYQTPHLFIHVFETLGSYIHVFSLFCSEHRACHLDSHFWSLFLAHSRWSAMALIRMSIKDSCLPEVLNRKAESNEQLGAKSLDRDLGDVHTWPHSHYLKRQCHGVGGWVRLKYSCVDVGTKSAEVNQ